MPGTVCPYCHKEFDRQWKLKRHLVVHTGERPYDCEFCPKNYNDKCALLRHIRTKHKDEREKRMKNHQSILPPKYNTRLKWPSNATE